MVCVGKWNGEFFFVSFSWRELLSYIFKLKNTQNLVCLNLFDIVSSFHCFLSFFGWFLTIQPNQIWYSAKFDTYQFYRGFCVELFHFLYSKMLSKFHPACNVSKFFNYTIDADFSCICNYHNPCEWYLPKEAENQCSISMSWEPLEKCLSFSGSYWHLIEERQNVLFSVNTTMANFLHHKFQKTCFMKDPIDY